MSESKIVVEDTPQLTTSAIFVICGVSLAIEHTFANFTAAIHNCVKQQLLQGTTMRRQTLLCIGAAALPLGAALVATTGIVSACSVQGGGQ
jgi:hypothetical protein